MKEEWARPSPSSSQGFRLADFAIHYPVTICMVLLSFLVLGGVSISKIPLVMLPEVDAPFMMVRVPYPNATPAQVEETITRPLEEVLSTLPSIQRITSFSNSDEAAIQLDFGFAVDADWLRSEVREKAEQARRDLPEDVEQIYVLNWNTNDIPIMEGRIASGRDLRGAYDFLDLKIKKPLERVPGVAEVRITGVERKEIDIDLRLEDLKRHRVDVGALFEALQTVHSNTTLGLLENGGLRLGVVRRGTLTSLEEIRNFPLRQAGLRLSDIADVEFADPASNYGRHLNGDYAISLEIRKTADANTVETVDRVMEKIAELNPDPSLQGIQLLIWHDAGKEITRSLSGLLEAGTVGALCRYWCSSSS